MQAKLLLLIALLAMGTSVLAAQNNMEVLFEITGNQWFDRFGEKLAALDFNGDHIQDLAVLQSSWVPDSLDALIGDNYEGRNWGRILFYYGGLNFNSTPDFIIEGERSWQFAPAGGIERFSSLGDMNGDGYDDLGIFDYPNKISIYFGGAQPSNQPGFQIDPIPGTNINGAFIFFPSGDLNGDSYDDVAYYFYDADSSTGYGSLRIVFGGSFQEIVVANTDSGNQDEHMIHGIGDINADGYDDYTLTIFQQHNGQADQWLYYGLGSSQFEPTEVVLLFDELGYSTPTRRPLGDLNNDGFDDFVGLMDGSIKIWHGGTNLNPVYDTVLTPFYTGSNGADDGLVYGDLNGDGFDDVIGADIGYGWWDGRACIWLGGANMNGVADMYINAFSAGMQMGKGIACGDFNADGCADLAISTPCFPNTSFFPGKLRVYAGNPQLADTTTAIDDDVVPGVESAWQFRAFPNPLSQGCGFTLKFYGSGYDAYHSLDMKVFNLRGQVVFTGEIVGEALRSSEVEIADLNLSAGVYAVALYAEGRKVRTIKLTVK